MAKARVNLKGVRKAVDRLTKDLKNLRRAPATPARKTEAAALHRRLKDVRTLLVGCPDNMFRLFKVAEPAAARRKAKTTRKSTRRGTRKVR